MKLKKKETIRHQYSQYYFYMNATSSEKTRTNNKKNSKPIWYSIYTTSMLLIKTFFVRQPTCVCETLVNLFSAFYRTSDFLYFPLSTNLSNIFSLASGCSQATSDPVRIPDPHRAQHRGQEHDCWRVAVLWLRRESRENWHAQGRHPRKHHLQFWHSGNFLRH